MRNQLINRLANDYTKDIVKNHSGKIFDHIVAMVDANPEIVIALKSHEVLLGIAKAYRNLLKTSAHTEGEVATYHHIENAIALAEGKA